MTKISVIMPAHNAEKTIEGALASAIKQTEAAIEIVLVDDASSDRTPEIAAAAAGRDGRVRLIRNFVNVGPGAARNLALDVAVGKWVAWLDADDAFHPERLARLVAIGEETGVDIVSDNLLLCPEDASYEPVPMLARERLAGGMLHATEFVLGNVGNGRRDRVSYGFMHPIIRRDFLVRNGIRFNPMSRFGEDYMLYLLCLVHGARWWYTPDAFYRYTVRAGSLTEHQSAADLDRIRELEASLLLGNAMVAADPSLARAILRHKTKIDRDYYYRAFTDAIKARGPREGLRVLLGSPAGFRHIVQESCYQVPTILRKALRGGYTARRTTERAA